MNQPAPVTFTFDGRTIPAQPGQSIAAALYAAGVRTFTRSFKYHRPRGLFCVSGDCPNCLMQVDGRPNVRTCIEPARQGQVVRHQNAWPSLGFDVLRVFDKLDRFLPVGFYYKHFHKPAWLWPVFEYVVRHIAGLGRIDVHARPERDEDVEYLHADVCVVGAGPAGLAAAAEAAGAGTAVLLLERRPELGGHLRYDAAAPAQLSKLLAAVEAQPQVRVLTGTSVFGLYEGHLLGAYQGNRLLQIRARQVIVCTGGRQRPFVFRNNDLPGIFLGNGVLRLARLDRVIAGRVAVVLTDNDDGQRLAGQLTELGITVAAVVDERPAAEATVSGDRRWKTLAPASIREACGRSHLRAVRVAGPGGVEQEIPCDLLCLVSKLLPANELLYQGGVRFRCESGCWRPTSQVPGLWAAGAAAGTWGLSAQIEEGRRRGAEAAAALHPDGSPVCSGPIHRAWGSAGPMNRATTNGEDSRPNGKAFICLCEDVTEKDLYQAIAEGFDHIETLKRYSTVNMGPCQGKMCGQAAIETCARVTGRDVNAVGATTSRPPVVPVPLGVLAAGQQFHPVRRTALHHWHAAAGARLLPVGLWQRPESYGDPVAEVRAVRNAVGLIDVSTLGKIEIAGADAVELLERVYLGSWRKLAAGKARYDAMCTEEGILFDDGIGCRLGPNRFYLTATTGNAEGVFQWLEMWKAVWGLDVTLLNQTSALAGMNLAGPRSREVLSQLAAIDLSPRAFPFMAIRDGEVAGVPCRLLRPGFVGELAYEIHCPSTHAWHLWEALLAAGARFGLRPFGVEAQRILRLEKGFLLLGHDTDALANPLEAGLGSMVNFDKPDFIGRDILLRAKAMPPRSRLVGFQMVDSRVVPPEGSQVVEQGRPVGRVTSARFSPTLERSIGLAWIPASRSAPGDPFEIRCPEGILPAEVASLPFFDPQGQHLRS
jgi:sarcosine oxidase subunit alpha